MTRPRSTTSSRTRLARQRSRLPSGPRARGVALVTGAARGIGAATVRRLSAEGWNVVARRPRRGRPAAALRDGHGGRAAGARQRARASRSRADVCDAEALAGAVEIAERRWGGLDAIVAAAGVIAGGVPAWELDVEQERAVLDVNLGGVLTAARVGIPALLRRPEPREGRFIAVASTAATRGLPMLAAYCASKAGVTGLIRALAVELGGTGITANAVSPGSTRTPILDESARLYGLESAEAFAAQQPLGRLARAGGGRGADRLAGRPAEQRRDGRHLPARRRPLALRLALDATLRIYGHGRVLVARGRIIRLTEHGPAALRALLADTATPAQRRLGDRLVAAGMAHPRPTPQHRPTTLVIPVRDRPADLARLLATLNPSSGPNPSERVDDSRGSDPAVVVVDDGSRVPVEGAIRREVSGGPGGGAERRAAGRRDRVRRVSGQRHGAAGRVDRAARRALRGSEGRRRRAADTERATGGGRRSTWANTPPRSGRAGTCRTCPRAALLMRTQRAPRRPVRPRAAVRRGRGPDLAADRRRLARALRPERRRRARGARHAQAALQVRDVGGAAASNGTPASSSTWSSGPWPAATLALLAARQPRLAALAYAAQTVQLARTLHKHQVPVRLAPAVDRQERPRRP